MSFFVLILYFNLDFGSWLFQLTTYTSAICVQNVTFWNLSEMSHFTSLNLSLMFHKPFFLFSGWYCLSPSHGGCFPRERGCYM